MRSIIWIVSLTVALGVLVARYADKVINAPAGNSLHSDAATTRSSSVAAVTVPSPTPQPVPQARPDPPAPAKPQLPQVITLGSSMRSVTLRSDNRGQFRVEARVDARRLDFIVDTGASSIALRESDAAKLGIHPMDRDYTVKTQTANGVGRGAPVRLNMIEIENITVRDVMAIVVPDDALKENLLGMSFLSRVRWMHDRGKLVLEQQ